MLKIPSNHVNIKNVQDYNCESPYKMVSTNNGQYVSWQNSDQSKPDEIVKFIPRPIQIYQSYEYQKAMGMLSTSVFNGVGFVKITGEAGTGKTTLCRTFLEGIEPQIASAYIFNKCSNLNALLKTILEEFNIEVDQNDTKYLTDKLNAFLMLQMSNNRKVVLIIDEAQSFKKSMLEQLRLLSNLETQNEKLLQIILVGQPELNEVLDSRDMRALNQRIAISYEINPMNFFDTKRYVQHRKFISSRFTRIDYSRGAYRKIFQFSGGVARKINTVCDQVLTSACKKQRGVITSRDITNAIHESKIKKIDVCLKRFYPDIKRLLPAGKKLVAMCCVMMFVAITIYMNRRPDGYYFSDIFREKPVKFASSLPGIPSVMSDIIPKGKYSVSFYYHDTENWEIIDRFSKILSKKGFIIRSFQKVPFPNQDIRYFHEDDHKAALMIYRHFYNRKNAQLILKQGSLFIKNLSNKYYNTRKGHIEMWLH